MENYYSMIIVAPAGDYEELPYEYNHGQLMEERICLACGVGGCDCDSACVNCGSKDPNHHCE